MEFMTVALLVSTIPRAFSITQALGDHPGTIRLAPQSAPAPPLAQAAGELSSKAVREERIDVTPDGRLVHEHSSQLEAAAQHARQRRAPVESHSLQRETSGTTRQLMRSRWGTSWLSGSQAASAGTHSAMRSGMDCKKPQDSELASGLEALPTIGSLRDPVVKSVLRKNAWPNQGLLKLDSTAPSPPLECVRKLPRNLHFVWMGSTLKEKHVEHLLEFAKLNADYKINLWVDQLPQGESWPDDLRSRWNSELPPSKLKIKIFAHHAHRFRNRDLICTNTNYAGKSDLIRYEVVYMEGGIYLDLDTVPFAGFNDYGSLFEWPFTTYKADAPACNCLFGFERHSGFLDFMINATRENCLKFNNCGVMGEAGCGPYTAALLQYNSPEITLLPHEFMLGKPEADLKQRVTAATFEGAEPGGWYKAYAAGQKNPDVGFCSEGEDQAEDALVGSGTAPGINLHASALPPAEEEATRVLKALESLKTT